MYQEATQVLRAWLDGVNAGDVERVPGLYNEEATLLPTFSDKLLSGRDSLRAYFERLSGESLTEVVLLPESVKVQTLGERSFSVAGMYDWDFEGKERIPARFTFCVEIGRADPIVHHHSSLLPHAP